MSYGHKAGWKEWGRYLVGKLGVIFGFPQAMLAGIVGTCLWLLSWAVLPGSWRVLYALPGVPTMLREAGIIPKHLFWGHVFFIALGTFMGLACWCRVLVLCHPSYFDRYKIRGIPMS